MEIFEIPDVTQETQAQTRLHSAFNLVGLIPLEGEQENFLLPWSDCMMPVSHKYLAFERAIVEAVTVGCNSIWLISYGGVGTLVKDRVGQWVRDPSTKELRSQIKVPVHYVQIKPDGLSQNESWSVIRTAKMVYGVHRKISQWVLPNRYYVSFPLSVYQTENLLDFRRDIRNRGGFFLSFNGKTIKDGERIGFSFNNNELIELENCYHQCKIDRAAPTLKNIFGGIKFWEKEVTEVELPFHYDISCWENYCLYLGSEDAKRIGRPEGTFVLSEKTGYRRTWKGLYK